MNHASSTLADAERILDLELTLCQVIQKSALKSRLLDSQREIIAILRARLEEAGIPTHVYPFELAG